MGGGRSQAVELVTMKDMNEIEDGKITRPIKDVNIIGNGPTPLEQVEIVGNHSPLVEGGWTCGKNGQSVPVSQGIPTVLVSKMTVGGENVG